jgi:hypothetical protein
MDIQSLVQIRPAERQIAWQELGFTAFLHLYYERAQISKNLE